MQVKAITSQAMRLLLKHQISIINTSEDTIVFSVPGIDDNTTSFELQDGITHIDNYFETKFTKLIIENDTLMLDSERHQRHDHVAFKVVMIGDNVIAVSAMYKGKRYKGVLLVDEE
jgi:CRISPR/Cas system-associated endonuclease Cas1